MHRQTNLPIGEAARFLGVSIDTLRRWDNEGKINSARAKDNTRLFSLEELEKVQKERGLSIHQAADEIGVSESTMRRLEKEGKVKPKRDKSGERVYSQNNLDKLLEKEPTLVQAGPELKEEHGVWGAVMMRHLSYIYELISFKRWVGWLVLVGIVTLLTLIIATTILFLAYPVETARFFGYRSYIQPQKRISGIVLGAATYPLDEPPGASTSPLGLTLRPLGQVSLGIVKGISRDAYIKAVGKTIEDVNDVLALDDNGKINPRYTLTFPDSSYLEIPDSNLIKNLNAEYLQGRVPGQAAGNLAVMGQGGTIEGLVIDEVEVGEGTITSNHIKDGEVRESDLKVVDSANDEECLTYETTTGDFEWQNCGSGGSSFNLTVEEGDTTEDTTVGTIDFLDGDFDISENPEDEVNISLASSLTSVMGVAGDFTVAGGDLTLNTAGTIVPSAAGTITIGNSSLQSLTITTDSTGNGEVVLPTGSIGSGEILDSTIAEADLNAVDTASDEECLTYETTTGDFEWQSCGSGGGGSSVWSSLTDPTTNLSLAMGENTTTFTYDTAATAATLNGLTLAITNDASTDSTTQNLLVLKNNSASGGTTDTLLRLENADDSTVTTGIEIVGSSTGSITTGIDASDGEIGTALAIGPNSITGTTGTIDFNNFDVSTGGTVTIADNQAYTGSNAVTFSSGGGASMTIDSSSNTLIIASTDTALSATGLATVTTATSLSLNPTSGTSYTLGSSATTVNLFNSTATTLNVGGAATTVAIGASTGTTTVNNGLVITGSLTSNGSFTLGDDGDTGSINTSDWNITTTGDMTGIGGLTMDGNFSQTGSTTFSTGTGAVSVNGAATFGSTATVTNTLTANGALIANGSFTLGDDGDTGSINTSDWNITTTGDMTGIGGLTMDGNFSQTGSTTFSTGTGAVSVNGAATFGSTAAFNGGVTFNTDVDFTLSGTENLVITNSAQGAADLVAISPTWTADNTADALALTLTYSVDTSGGTIYGLNLVNADNGGSLGVIDALGLFSNDQATETLADGLIIRHNAASGTMTDGLQIENTTAGGTITNAINIVETAGTIATGVNIGGNLTTGVSFGSSITNEISFSDTTPTIQLANASALAVTDGTNDLLSLRDLNTNFGAAVTSGAFISRNSYFGDEFAVHRSGACNGTAASSQDVQVRGDYGNPSASCAVNTGELSYSATVTAGVGSCSADSVDDAVGGQERNLASTTTLGVGSAACLLKLGDGTTIAGNQNIYAAANLPVFVTKAKVAETPSTDHRFFLGMGDLTIGSTTPPTNGIYFSNCSNNSVTPTCDGGLYGVSATGVASSTSVSCGTITAGNMMYMRVEVRATNDVHFFADLDTSNGITETECGSGLSSTTTSAMTAIMNSYTNDTSAGASTTTTVDIDYFRSWQDDNVPVLPASVAAEEIEQVSPLVVDSTGTAETPNDIGVVLGEGVDGEAHVVPLIKLIGEDRIVEVDGDLRVKGELVAGRVKAAQIEGLEATINKVSAGYLDINKLLAQSSDRLAEEIAAKVGTKLSQQPVPTVTAEPTPQLNTDLLIKLVRAGGLVIEGTAEFKGEVVVSQNTAGKALIRFGLTEVEVKFDKPYESAPMVVASPDYPVLYAVSDVSANGFKIKMAAAVDREVGFFWMVLGVRQPRTHESGAVLPRPASIEPTLSPLIPTQPLAASTPSITVPDPTLILSPESTNSAGIEMLVEPLTEEPVASDSGQVGY